MSTGLYYRTAFITITALVICGCTATNLRTHNIQLEQLIETRAIALQELRAAVKIGGPNVLEQERRFEQAKFDLAALAFDASEDAKEADDPATKVGFQFTSARAGSKAGGKALSETFATKIAAAKSTASNETEATEELSAEDPVNPFYYGIVVPAREICNQYKQQWTKPARDCAYMEVVGYFAAIDDLVAIGQELEDERNRTPGKELPTDRLSDVVSNFTGLNRQFDNINDKAVDAVIEYGVDESFITYIDRQLFRTYCSADVSYRNLKKIEDDAGDTEHESQKPNLDMMRDALVAKKDTTLAGFFAASGGPDCAKAKKF